MGFSIHASCQDARQYYSLDPDTHTTKISKDTAFTPTYLEGRFVAKTDTFKLYFAYPFKKINDSIVGFYGDSVQLYTTGSSEVVVNKVDVLVINPASTVASLTITFPDTASYKNSLEILFGGTIAYGDEVITSITFTAGSGQTIIMPPESGPINSGTNFHFKYIVSTKTWYLE